MAKVSIAEFAKAQPIDPAPFGEQLNGDAEALGLFTRDRDPLHARLLRLGEGGRVAWHDSLSGHLVYVWQGAVINDGLRLPAGSVLVVEHGGSAEAEAVEADTLLLVFNRATSSGAPARAGGHVHRLPADKVLRKVPLRPGGDAGGAIFADSTCPTCELWLHENSFPKAGHETPPHSHDEDEIIVVTEGEIKLGPRFFGPGTAVAIARNTIYGFHTGDTGLKFINFRTSSPSYTLADGSLTLDEAKIYRETLGEIIYS